MKIKCFKMLSAEKRTILSKSHLNKPHDNHTHTEKRPRAGTQNMKKQEVERHITENLQAKMANGNTRKKKQRSYRATRKQKINGSTKSSFINSQSKCKWMELTNEKTHSGGEVVVK